MKNNQWREEGKERETESEREYNEFLWKLKVFKISYKFYFLLVEMNFFK